MLLCFPLTFYTLPYLLLLTHFLYFLTFFSSSIITVSKFLLISISFHWILCRCVFPFLFLLLFSISIFIFNQRHSSYNLFVLKLKIDFSPHIMHHQIIHIFTRWQQQKIEGKIIRQAFSHLRWWIRTAFHRQQKRKRLQDKFVDDAQCCQDSRTPKPLHLVQIDTTKGAFGGIYCSSRIIIIHWKNIFYHRLDFSILLFLYIFFIPPLSPQPFFNPHSRLAAVFRSGNKNVKRERKKNEEK